MWVRAFVPRNFVSKQPGMTRDKSQEMGKGRAMWGGRFPEL